MLNGKLRRNMCASRTCFRTLWRPTCVLSRRSLAKISASELRRKLIKRTLLVGHGGTHHGGETSSLFSLSLSSSLSQKGWQNIFPDEIWGGKRERERERERREEREKEREEREREMMRKAAFIFSSSESSH